MRQIEALFLRSEGFDQHLWAGRALVSVDHARLGHRRFRLKDIYARRSALQPSAIVCADGGFRCFYWPGIANAMLKLELTSFHPRRVVLLGDLHAGVAEQDRNLIDRHAGKQHFHRERVTKHVWMTTLDRTVRPGDVGQGEEPAIASLPVGDDALRRTVAAPEKIAGVGLWTIWDIDLALRIRIP
jgi:hypothetical protein